MNIPPPWWTRKENTKRRQILQLILQDVKTVPLEPGDLILHPVNFGIVFRASQDCRVFLNRVDAFPSAGLRKGNGIPTCSGEGVDEDAPSSWCGLRDVTCYFATSVKN